MLSSHHILGMSQGRPTLPWLLDATLHPRILPTQRRIVLSLYAIAAAHPEIDFLGCEVFAAGVGALCLRIQELSLTNIRIARHDAVEVVRDMIAPDSLSGIHIFFPDPWRKARHHKRRLIQGPFVHLLAQKLAPGGYLHCATDWENYAEQMLDVLQSESLLTNAHGTGFSPVQANPLCERPRTKFQARGEGLGYGIWDLVFTRR